MRRRLTSLIAICALAGLTACGGSNKSLLSTGSIFGNKAKVAAPGKPALAADPMARPVQLGWVSARAVKCGFYFDPARLKQQYLAAEAQRGLSEPELRKIELSYRYSVISTSKKIAGQDSATYCSKTKAAAIRKDLQRHLAGDFAPSPPPVKKEQAGSFWSLPEQLPEKMDREKIFSPTGQ